MSATPREGNMQNVMRMCIGAAMIAFISNAYADDPRLLHQALYGGDTEVPVDFRGWVSGGFTLNTDRPDGNFNGPLSFNDRTDELQMNQAYIIAERAIDPSKDDFQLGGRVDFVYGTDSAFTQAYGLDTRWSEDRFYRPALPQFYVEAFAPALEGVRLKVGHFYTPIGYEVVTAPDNFFYSHAFTMQYGEPFTHTGGMLSVAPIESVTVSGGIVRGWDNFEDPDGDLAYIAGVTWAVDDSMNIILTAISGNEGENLNRTMYSVVGTHQFGENWTYALQHDYGTQERGAPSGEAAQWYGVNQYLVYKMCDAVSLGSRVEWFSDDDGVRVVGLRSGSAAAPGDFFGFSFGANYSPTSYLKIRPEIRWDLQHRSDDTAPRAYENGDSLSQLTLGSDVIFSF